MSNYAKGNEFVQLFNNVDNKFFNENNKVSAKISFVEKNDEIERSALYTFDSPLQLLHADVAKLEFLRKSATTLDFFYKQFRILSRTRVA